MNPIDWASAWSFALGLPAALPQWVVASMALIFVFWVIILPSGALISYLDRKLGADLQARVGPNRAGPMGLFQPLADLLKLLQKSGSVRWNWGEALWLAVHTMALYSTVAVLPLGSVTLMVNTDMSAFLPFWAALVLALGTMLLGLSQGSVAGWFGGIRVAAQTLAGAFPALVALLAAGLHSGGFRWSQFVACQSTSPLQWTFVGDPFLFLAFVVFVLSGLVLLAVPPLDGGLSTPDIHGGVTSNLFGKGYGLFRLGRFYGFFLWSVITVVLFLGGWALPSVLARNLAESENWRLLEFLELSWLLGKTLVLMLGIVWIAEVNPRGRVDHVTNFALKVLSPFSLVALIGEGCLAAWRALS